MSDIVSYIQNALQLTGPSTSSVPLKASAPPLHPYYPLGISIVGYQPNTHSILYLLGAFAATCTVVLGSTALLVKRLRPGIGQPQLLTLLWFMLSGCIHLFFEGFYAFNYADIGAQNHIFAQLWKEYSMSDSRYLTQDAFVLIMESITAVCWGPLSLALVYLIASDSPYRHPFQLIVSLGQLYGDVLYYGTSMFDHFFYAKSYSHPHPYYFWGYYVFMNTFWIVIPLILINSSVREMARCVTLAGGEKAPTRVLEAKAHQAESKKAKGKTNGSAK